MVMKRLSRFSFFLIFILFISTQMCYSADGRNKRQGDYGEDKFLSTDGQKVEALNEKPSANEVEENFVEDTANNDEEEDNGLEKEEYQNLIPPGEGPKKADEVALSHTNQETEYAHEQYDNEQNNAEKQTESPDNNEQNNGKTESPTDQQLEKRKNDGNVVFERKSSPSAVNTAQPDEMQWNAASGIKEEKAESAVINDETIETAKAEFGALDEKTKTELPVHKNEAGFGDATNSAANGQPVNSVNKSPIQQLPTPLAQAANAAVALTADAAAITNHNGHQNAIIGISPKVGNVNDGATDTRNLPSVGNPTAVQSPVEGKVGSASGAANPTESKAFQQSNINGLGSAINSRGVATNFKEQAALDKRTDPAGQLSASKTNTGVAPFTADQQLRRVSPPFGDEVDVNANAKDNINTVSNVGAVGNANVGYNNNNTANPKTAGNTDAAANPISAGNASPANITNILTNPQAAGSTGTAANPSSAANANGAGKTGSDAGAPVAKEVEGNVANQQPAVDGSPNAAAGPAVAPTGPSVPGAGQSPVVNQSGNEQSTAAKTVNTPSTLDKAKEAGGNQSAGPVTGLRSATDDLKQAENGKDLPAESKVPASAAAQTTAKGPSAEVKPVVPSTKPVVVAPKAPESTAQQPKAPESTHSTQAVNKQPTEEEEENKDNILVPEVTKSGEKATTKERIDQQTEPTEEQEENEEEYEEKVSPGKQPSVAAPELGSEPYAPGTGLAGKSFAGGVRPPTYYPIQGESSHFMTYLISFTVLVVVAYLVFHNKQKILGLMVEGRGGPRGRRGSTRYRKLDRQQNGEDTAPLFSEKGGNNVIY